MMPIFKKQVKKPAIFAFFLTFLLIFPGLVSGKTRTELYNDITATRNTLGVEVTALQELQAEITTLQAQIAADPFNETARAQFAAKVSEGKERSSKLQEQVAGYNSYLDFIRPAFMSQGTGWAALYYKTVVPQFSDSVVTPGAQIETEFQDASATYPIDPFPTAPTVSVSADAIEKKYGETVNLTAATTGSGTITVTWATTAGTLSAVEGPSVSLVLPTGTDGAPITVSVSATAANQKDSAMDTIDITATAGALPSATITSPTAGTRIGWGETLPVTATKSGDGTVTIDWTPAPSAGSISPATGESVIYTAPAGGGADPDVTVTLTALAKSSFGTVSTTPSTVTVTVGTSTIVLSGGSAPIEGLSGDGEIGGALAGE